MMFGGLVELLRGDCALNPLIESTAVGDAGWAQQAPEELAGALSAVGVLRHVEGGERLFSCGEAATGVYLILKGRARAVLPGLPGRELVCLTAGPGSVLGLHSALCAKSYQFDVECLEAVEARYVPMEQIHELLRVRPELGLLAMNMMCNELSALKVTRKHLSNCTNQACGLFGCCTKQGTASGDCV
jgi:CRP-like cAMP-binding protein